MNELETAFMEKLSDKAANMSPEEKKAMKVIQKAWAGLSSSEKSKFILAYAKNPSQAIDHIMKGLKKEELGLDEDLETIIEKMTGKQRYKAGKSKSGNKSFKSLRNRLTDNKELEEAKKPSDDDMIDVMGPAKNSKEAVKLLSKKFKLSPKDAEKEVKRLLKKLLGESLKKDIAALSAKFPEGSTVTMKHNKKKGKVLSVGKDHVIVGIGNKTHTHKPDELIPESVELDEAALKTSDYPKGTSMSAKKFKDSQKKMSKQRALSTKDYPKGTSMSATAWKNRQEEVELDEQRVVAVPADAKLKLKKGQQVLLYTTRGGQKMKIAVDKSQAFKALGHYRSMGMTNVSLESVQEGVEEGMSKKNYKAQKSKTQKKSFNSLRGRLADENEEEIAESNMDALRKIVDDKAMGKINGVKVDMTTAHMMLTVHKALNDKNKKALEGLVNGDKAQFMRAHALVMKILSK